MLKYLILSVFCCFLMHTVRSQSIGIGTNNPHNSSLLELRSTSKGFLIPRLHLLSETDSTTIVNPQTSLLVFNLNNALADGTGYYYWNNVKWVKLIVKGSLDNYTWIMTGNAGTNPDSNFIGTTDNKALVFKTNNILSGKIDPVRNMAFFGQSAGRSQISGINNAYFGQEAGAFDTSGFSNVFAGHASGYNNSSGAENVFVGQEAGFDNVTGSRNTFIGEDAGEKNKHGEDNVFVGNRAGTGNKNGNRNTLVGAVADSEFDSSLTNSTAIGYNASVAFSNSMVFGDNNVTSWYFGRTFPSLAAAVFQVGFNPTNGNAAFLSATGTWVSISDSTKKEGFSPVNREELLQKILQLDIQRWRYKKTNEYHIGPVAQQFYRVFNVGTTDTGISALDPAGIALAAIQELIQKNNSLEAELKEIKALLKAGRPQPE
jgi:Chaperone of endosialidase